MYAYKYRSVVYTPLAQLCITRFSITRFSFSLQDQGAVIRQQHEGVE